MSAAKTAMGSPNDCILATSCSYLTSIWLLSGNLAKAPALGYACSATSQAPALGYACSASGQVYTKPEDWKYV
uniref:Antifreeze protein n=1 Tax=Romanomermis culicivorax TaxID=13658 RepID=A0A915JXG6_ROMCU